MHDLKLDSRFGLIFAVRGRFYAACAGCGDVREITHEQAHGPGYETSCEACYSEIFLDDDRRTRAGERSNSEWKIEPWW